MKAPETDPICTIRDLHIGTRLLVRGKFDWRTAAIASKRDDRIVLTVSTATGRRYRKLCEPDTCVELQGSIPVIGDGDWRRNLQPVDVRW